jgi:hypothetical protein
MADQTTLASRFEGISAQAKVAADEYSGVLGSVKGQIVEHFGENGLIAAYIVLTVLILVLVSRLTKITFSAFKYLVIPALALAFVGSMMTSYTFAGLLPVTVTACSLLLLFKG